MARSRSFAFCGLVSLVVAALCTAAADDSVSPERLNLLIEKYEAQETAIGAFATDLSTENASAMGAASFDFAIIDIEHVATDFETLQAFILAMRSEGRGFVTTPIVRIPANGREVGANQWMFKQALDAGAFGVMVPHVNTAAQARAAVVAMRYPPTAKSENPVPRGERGWYPFRALAAWNLDASEYARRADVWPLSQGAELVFIAQIETAEAIDNLGSILSVPGVSGAFIGPADLHADMGFLGGQGEPAVEAKIEKAARTSRKRGASLGIPAGPDDIARRLEQGFTFFTIGANGMTEEEIGAVAKASAL